MCIICLELQKGLLTPFEATRNLTEMVEQIGEDHLHEVFDLIMLHEEQDFAIIANVTHVIVVMTPIKESEKCLIYELANASIRKPSLASVVRRKDAQSPLQKPKIHKKLYSLDESSEEHIFILDAVNEVVSSLPIGHKNRNSQFAKQILQKVFEEFTNHGQISYEEVLEITKKLSGGIELL